MSKIKIFRKLLGVISIISLVIFLTSLLPLLSVGGCNTNSELKDLNNPSNINISVTPNKCIGGFKVTNNGDGISLIAIRGNIETFDGKKRGFLSNTLVCVSWFDRSNWSEKIVSPINSTETCEPFILEAGKAYQFYRVTGPWELTTNRGTVTGVSKSYSALGNFHLLFLLNLFVLIFSYIFYTILKRKARMKS